MNKTTNIKTELRAVPSKRSNNELKKNGYILGNIVGKGIASTAVAVKKADFRKALAESGRNSVLTLDISDDQQYSVMVQEIHREPLKNEITHVDFKVVSFTEKMKQEVVIKIIGTEMLEPQKLRVNSHVNSIVVEGLPQGIPDEIEIDVSDLEDGESILFGDIKLAEEITSDLAPEQKILTVVGSKMNEPAESDEPAESEEEVSE